MMRSRRGTLRADLIDLVLHARIGSRRWLLHGSILLTALHARLCTAASVQDWSWLVASCQSKAESSTGVLRLTEAFD